MILRDGLRRWGQGLPRAWPTAAWIQRARRLLPDEVGNVVRGAVTPRTRVPELPATSAGIEALGRRSGPVFIFCVLADAMVSFLSGVMVPLGESDRFLLVASVGTALLWDRQHTLRVLGYSRTVWADEDVALARVWIEQMAVLGGVLWAVPLLTGATLMGFWPVALAPGVWLVLLAGIMPPDPAPAVARVLARERDEAWDGHVPRMRTLRNVQVLRHWGTLLLGCAGEEEGFYRGVEAQLAALNPPRVKWQRTSMAPSFLKGLLGKRRTFLFITNRQLRDYRICICGRAYGTSLDVSWYVVISTRTIIAFLLGFIPIVSMFIGIYLRRKRLDVFDQQELDAYQEACELAVRQTVKDLLAKKNLEQEIDWKAQSMVRAA